MTGKRLPPTLTDAAVRVLTDPDPMQKVTKTLTFAEAWQAGTITAVGDTVPPDRPARPAAPELLPPGKVRKRGLGSENGRIAFVHAIAHIELNAIDLAWDIVARFTAEPLPRAFFDAWVETARDEAVHFRMLDRRLRDFGAKYGDLPAHDGLWRVAESTSDDLLARLALVPMVLEARGLDTAPAAVIKLREVGDLETAAVLEQIGEEEIPHVAAGTRWFEHGCRERGLDPVKHFHDLVRARFGTDLRPPFNEAARSAAGMKPEFYLPLIS